MAGSEVRPTNTIGKYRQGGKGVKPALAADVLVAYQGTILDPTASNAVIKAGDLKTDLELPRGFRPMYVVIFGSATGTNPTIDVGYVGGGADALVNEGDADGYELATSGTSLGVALAADTKVESSAGASAPTGGVVGVWVVGAMAAETGRDVLIQ